MLKNDVPPVRLGETQSSLVWRVPSGGEYDGDRAASIARKGPGIEVAGACGAPILENDASERERHSPVRGSGREVVYERLHALPRKNRVRDAAASENQGLFTFGIRTFVRPQRSGRFSFFI